MPRAYAQMFESLWCLLRNSVVALLLVGVMALAAPSPGWTQDSPAVETSGQSQQFEGEGRYAGLLELLKDPAKRDELIRELETLSAAQTSDSSDDQTEEGADSAGVVDGLAGGIFATVGETFAGMASSASRLASGGIRVDWLAVGQVAWRVLVLLALTHLVLVLGRLLLRRVWRRLESYAQSSRTRYRLIRTGVAVLASLALGLMLVAAAYLLAQAGVWWLTSGDSLTREVLGLVLQAFVVVEVARLIVAVAFAPALPGLRLFPISEESSRFWSGWLTRVIRFIGYAGIMLVPAIHAADREDLATAVGWVAALLALLYTWSRLWRARSTIGDALAGRAEYTQHALTSWALEVLAGSWHWLAMLYALGVFMVAISRPGEALPFVALATFNTAVIVGVAIFVAAMLSQWISRGVPVPAGVAQRLPTLQLRVNTYVPAILRVARFLIGLIAVFGVLGAWHLVNVFAWLGSDEGRWLLAAIVDITLVLLIALTTWLVVTGMIESKLNSDKGMPSARMQTLLALFRSAIAIVLLVITAMIILSELGVNIGPLLAGAGVLGLAVGFGAQKLVQDVITGVFIQIENAINAGDVITIGGVTGTAERLSIRSVSIRDLSGTVHIVPFSSVDIVSNYMREFAFHKGEYGIAYRENIDHAIVQLKAAFEELVADPEWKDHILEPIEIPGVTALADSSVNIRVLIKTTPGDQWAVGRAYNRLVKMYFDKAGIEIPFPHTTLYFGVDKNGTAPPANVHLLKGEQVIDDNESDSVRSSRPGEKPHGSGGRVPASEDVDLPKE